MEKIKLSNDAGLTLTVSNEPPGESDDVQSIWGGSGETPSWEEYLDWYKEEFRPHLQLIKRAIEELGWVGETANNMANNWNFHFSDGTVIRFTWGAWGDLMSAIVGKNEGYMTYYM